MANRFFKNSFGLAAYQSAWFATSVLAVIARLDGSNVALFHIEHFGDTWEWRMRLKDSEWSSSVRASGSSALVPLTHATEAVWVEWRAEKDGPWQKAVPHEFGVAECDFAVKAQRVYRHPAGEAFTVCAPVHGHVSVWNLEMGDAAMDAGQVRMVRGVSVNPGIGQVLREAGDFQSAGLGFSVMNAGASQAALLPVLAALPGVMEWRGGFWGLKTGSIPPDEVILLKQEIQSMQSPP